MQKLFKGNDGRLRPWVQFILIFLTIVVGQIGVVTLAGIPLILYSLLIKQINILGIMQSSLWFTTIGGILSNILIVVVAVALYKAMNQKTLSDMGLTPFKESKRHFIAGLLLGVISIVGIVICLVITGSYEFVGFYLTPQLLLGIVIYTAVGFGEEILVRGAFQHILADRYKAGVAIVIPAILFSVMHFLNPNIAPIPVFNLFFVGILFGVMTYKTGDLWSSIGYHITWNFTMGSIFGIEVSGLNTSKALIQMKRTVDTAFNGGNFGLEGGYLCTTAIAIGLIYFLFIYKRSEKTKSI